MEYKQIKYLTIFSIILGIFISMMLLNMMNTCGISFEFEVEGSFNIYHFWSLPELRLVILYDVILTVILMIVIPILYLRSKNPKRLQKRLINIQVREVPKSIYCPECGVEILDITKEYCSQCGNKIILQ